MPEPHAATSLLRDGFILLGSALAFVLLFRRLGLGATLGYLVAGAVMGPHVLGLVGDAEDKIGIAELGIVLLLFVVGLELAPTPLGVGVEGYRRPARTPPSVGLSADCRLPICASAKMGRSLAAHQPQRRISRIERGRGEVAGAGGALGEDRVERLAILAQRAVPRRDGGKGFDE